LAQIMSRWYSIIFLLFHLRFSNNAHSPFCEDSSQKSPYTAATATIAQRQEGSGCRNAFEAGIELCSVTVPVPSAEYRYPRGTTYARNHSHLVFTFLPVKQSVWVCLYNARTHGQRRVARLWPRACPCVNDLGVQQPVRVS